MKCPRCGHEMTLDTHRKYALNMCYECGYIEGRLNDGPGAGQRPAPTQKPTLEYEKTAPRTVSTGCCPIV